MELRPLIFCFLFSISMGWSQSGVSYNIDAALNIEKKQVVVNQKVHIEPHSLVNDTLYFNDWNHAYSSSKTPLANRFAEEFDRRFYLAAKNRLGATRIFEIKANDNTLRWFRPKGHPDQLGLIIPTEALEKGIDLLMRYQLTLPDARFSGYGFNENEASFQLREWLLTYTGPETESNSLISNLNLDDQQHLPAQYRITLQVPSNYQVVSALPRQNNSLWSGRSIDCPSFWLNTKEDFFDHQLDNGVRIFSDIDYPDQMHEESERQFQKIYRFLNTELGLNDSKQFVITKEAYNKHPFYGLNQLPAFLSPFSKSLLNELKIVKVFARNYFQQQLALPKRENQWLLEGLPVYLVIKYIETYYPSLRFMGELSNIFYLRTYGIAKMPFNDGFMTYTEFVLRNNLHQEAASEKSKLSRFNERIAIPYHVGIGLRYLESYMGDTEFRKILQDLAQSNNTEALKAVFHQEGSVDIQWFYDEYIHTRLGLDFRLRQKKLGKDQIQIQITEKTNRLIPVKVSLLKDTEVLLEKWVIPHPDSLLVFDKGKSNQVAVNPFIGLPESNKENNWKSTQSKLFKKPFSLKFVKDIEVPNRNQLFVNPINNYNAYDGISLGLRLHNKKLTRQNFKIDIRPQYSFLEENLVGSYSLSARFNSLERKNYLTTIALGGSSYHYASGLRYNVIAPQLAFFFRTPDFRSNKRQVLSASWYSISKEIAAGVDTSPEYGVFKGEHLYSNKAAINHLTFGSSLELANSFSKIRFNLDYRKLFTSGRQFQARFFAGKFLSNKVENDGFFDFSLTRPNDYLYQYQYLGRSDTTGFYSQQFILAEGGLKSNITNPNVGDYLLSTNLMLSLWKWIEVYGDITLAKNYHHPLKSYWGTGIRLNLVPDYLEVYFPVYSNFGFELNNNAYARDLRLVLTIQPKQLMTLFTRKWF
jgi:hypothetical protein